MFHSFLHGPCTFIITFFSFIATILLELIIFSVLLSYQLVDFLWVSRYAIKINQSLPFTKITMIPSLSDKYIVIVHNISCEELYQNSVNLWWARVLLYIAYFTALHALGSWLAVNAICCCWGNFYEWICTVRDASSASQGTHSSKVYRIWL